MTRDRPMIPPHEPGTFHWCVDRVDLGHPTLSAIVRVICRDQNVWPEQMLGYNGAGGGVHPKTVPLATGRCDAPSRQPRIVFARRLVWRLAGELTDLSDDMIGELVGGVTGATVHRWAQSWRPFRESEGRDGWWQRWGPHFMDLGELHPRERAAA